MELFHHGAVRQVATERSELYAFKIEGHIDDDASEALAQFMLDAFVRHVGRVDMLLDLTDMTGSDWDNLLQMDVLKSRFRAMSEVRRYAVIGAPDPAQKMINLLNDVITPEARAYDADEAGQAWAFVDEPQQAA